MPPLKLAMVGVLIAAVDLRLNGFDFVPDPIGWAIAAWAVSQLVDRARDFATAAAAAGVAAVLSIHTEWLPMIPGASLVGLLIFVCDAAFVWFVCGGIIALARPAGDQEAVRTGGLVRVWNAGLSALLVAVSAVALLTTGGQGVHFDGDSGLFLVPLILVGLGLTVWFIVYCWGNSEKPYLAAQSPPLGPGS